MIDGSPRILIVRLSAIGDVVRVLPALHVLREAYPDARIDWAIERKSANIVEGHPALDSLLTFDRPAGRWRATSEFLGFCRAIRRNRYDVVLDFHGIFKSGFIAGFSGARKRFGFAPPRSQELSHIFTNSRVTLQSPRLNRVEENLLLCQQFVGNHPWPNVTIYVPRSIQESIDEFVDETFDGGKLIVAMHVPVERMEKQWPAAKFAALADLLLADGRFEVMLTWGPGQFKAVEDVVRRCRRSPIVAPQTPDLKHYAWLVNRSSLYVGGDTGPMHIAWTMGTPVVAVFNGTDPAKHAPYRRPHVILCAGTCEYPTDTAHGNKGSACAATPEAAYDACVTLMVNHMRESHESESARDSHAETRWCVQEEGSGPGFEPARS